MLIRMSNAAEHIIRKCGGAARVAEMLGMDVSSVHRWTYPRDKKGAAGRVPSKRQAELLAKAREAGIDLTPGDFFDEAGRAA